MTVLPKMYGEVLSEFNAAELADYVAAHYVADLIFREWVDVFDRVQRAEKVSRWTQWSAEETAAFDAGDHRLFSRLRGYSEPEIADFVRYCELCDALIQQPGGEDLCLDAMVEIQRLVTTDAFVAVEEHLSAMSDDACRPGTTETSCVQPQGEAAAADGHVAGSKGQVPPPVPWREPHITHWWHESLRGTRDRPSWGKESTRVSPGRRCVHWS